MSQTEKLFHETRHYLNISDIGILKAGVSAIYRSLLFDGERKYKVRDVLFDGMYAKSSKSTSSEKLRVRIYGDDFSKIFVQKVYKDKGTVKMYSERISRDECEKMFSKNPKWMTNSPSSLIREFGVKSVTEQLAPKSITEYIEEAFENKNGTVTVLFNTEIKCCDYRSHKDVFSNGLDLDYATDSNTAMMEIKYDKSIPESLIDLVSSLGKNKKKVKE